MHFAAFKGNYDMLLVLIEYGANPFDRGHCCVNYLQCGAQGDKPMSIAFFIVLGMDVNEKDNNDSTALHWVCFASTFESLRMLLSIPGIDVDVEDRNKQTPLHIAAQKAVTHANSTKMVRALL